MSFLYAFDLVAFVTGQLMRRSNESVHCIVSYQFVNKSGDDY